MKRTSNFLLALVLFLFCSNTEVKAQEAYKVHSHNDYNQQLPFWYAYSNGAASIEADLFLKNDTLYVTHSKDEIVPHHTFEKLYLERLKSLSSSGDLRELQVLIDLKSEAYTTLQKLVEVLENYPSLIKENTLHFVISGNRPKPSDYKNYPDFIWFDHQNLNDIDSIPLDKVALVSLSFKNYTVWNGYGRPTAADAKKVQAAIAKAKSSGKPFRFWATPDTKTAWARLAKMGVDYINTDQPALAKQYLDKLEVNTYQKETPIKVYQPEYKYDTYSPPKNIILMIGDGNGLAQISAAIIANQGNLTLTSIKDIGLVKTASNDDLVTDSAGGATAMATGSKSNNRAIGVDSKGKVLPNIIDITSNHGYTTAIVSTDAIYGATPASFYAHRVERDDTQGILTDLKQSKLNFFMTGGKSEEETINDVFVTQKMETFTTFKEPTAIYLGDNKVPSIKEGRKNVFPESVKLALEVLNSKKEPFFLMVEGAQIDNGGHSNSTRGIVEEMLDFDKVIAEALQFADKNQHTLVVIAADHETSGFGIVGGEEDKGMVQGDFLTVDHTGIMVPLFSYGPGAHYFNGVYENTAIFEKIIEVLALD
ncbi:alkaline phosphatase [Saonia flava]|uniref:Alkaline phosphatase n=1 Tax=Saonia flava TaxID=523696 RepID=A0A846QVX3_9FLAO|nr:alkaline phosphatase [Saonia flava]NJB71080.1 alkaline phosphatase [Saonia flava]